MEPCTLVATKDPVDLGDPETETASTRIDLNDQRDPDTPGTTTTTKGIDLDDRRDPDDDDFDESRPRRLSGSRRSRDRDERPQRSVRSRRSNGHDDSEEDIPHRSTSCTYCTVSLTCTVHTVTLCTFPSSLYIPVHCPHHPFTVHCTYYVHFLFT